MLFVKQGVFQELLVEFRGARSLHLIRNLERIPRMPAYNSLSGPVSHWVKFHLIEIALALPSAGLVQGLDYVGLPRLNRMYDI